MKTLVPAPSARPAGPSFINRALDGVTRLIDAALNRVFSLTHRVSLTRWSAVRIGFLLAWMVSVAVIAPEVNGSAQFFVLMNALLAFKPPEEVTPLITKFIFTVVLHPIVVRHLLALYVPFWLMRRISAIYLADIFEKPEETARQFIMQAAFGQGYSTIHIKQGRVVEADQGSTIIQIGGPGYVQVELDSAVLFERPDGSVHVIGPTGSEVIDDFERLRRVVDLRDSIESVDLAPTRSKDGIIVGAKDIQFSYSIYRGEETNRTETPYPFSKKAVESLVYKDSRTVKPGIAPARAPEWQSGPFKMGGPIMGEMGGFISKRGLSEFLAAIGKPEEQSLKTREDQIDQRSQVLSGLNGNLNGDLPLKAPDFSSRTFLTDQFYSQDGFLKRMADKGFQLNWIGVGTWFTPADIIPSKHKEAWTISRENYSRGNKQAIEGVQNEAKLQELLRLVQTLPINKFYNGAEKVTDGNYDRLLGELLQDYEEILQRAADLYLRGANRLDFRISQLSNEATNLYDRPRRMSYSDYDNFLQDLALMGEPGADIFSPEVEEQFRQAAEIFENLSAALDNEDQEFLKRAIKLYNDLKIYNQMQRAIEIIRMIRRPQYSV